MANEVNRSAHVSDWQAAMRQAMFGAVTQRDIGEIMAAVVAKAKKGDLKAAEFLFRWTVGQNPTLHVRQVSVEQGPKTIDVTDRRSSDPTPEEIERQKLKARNEHLMSMLDRKAKS